MTEAPAEDRLQECEAQLESMEVYEKGQVTALLVTAKEAMAVLLAENLAIESALPALQAKEKHHIAQQHAHMHEAADSAAVIDAELSDLHAYTGDLCALIAPQKSRLVHLQRHVEYLNVLLEVETISTRAKDTTNGDIDSLVALAAINARLPTLFGLETSLHLKLRTLITDRMAYLAHAFQAFHTEQLESILGDLDWPRPLSDADRETMADTCEAFRATFARLVQLQLSLASVAIGDSSATGLDLWAIECLLSPLVQRFRYHFDTQQKTNDVTKPEWFFTYILETLHGHYTFVQTCVAPALRDATASMPDTKHPLDAMSLFIQGLLMPLRHKVSALLPLVVESKPLLCHAIDEIVAFEKTLRDDFGYVTVQPHQQFKRARIPTVLDLVAQSPKVFGLWTQMDREYAQSFLTTYLQDATAWDLVLDASDDDLRVTNAAYAAASCLDALKQRFQGLSDPAHRYAYVVQVLKPFLQHSYTLFATYAKTQKIYAAMHAPSDPTWHRYCAAVNSCHFVRLVLTEWDETALFVELLQMAKAAKIQRPALRLRLPQVQGLAHLNPLLKREEAQVVTNALLGPASLIVPTAALSAAFSVGSSVWQSLKASPDAVTPHEVVPDKDAGNDDSETLVLEGSMFENEITLFRTLVEALEADLLTASVTAIVGAWETRYRTSPLWTTTQALEYIVQDVSCELGDGLRLLTQHLAQAQTALSSTLFQTYWKHVATELDGYLLNSILHHKTISAPGRAQLAVDVQMIVSVFRPYTAKPMAYLRGSSDAVTVLTMDESKADVLAAALSHGKDAMEQLTTMLEASHIHALRPSQVLLLLRA
ncbi:hypothetical protein SDRG_17080 [Saprolegnia diclina VS20]|uniref:RAD50-interacting protein 1 n=1 Tax=Saprolegnia diclina (strain VS20) TaxID=1156394 RepID=T0QZ56_SAPDV|nr:hypothetical protein SDRG_17080 [Saprolegnia diclina VS20]EQC25033.1 hypothetical protein SDRG_17080 [Saprolegnia diclina VS20]|eukprot:XP_008621537.1 hypothetical protein SDRG_17080 [Saprolegnia diclina VS20]